MRFLKKICNALGLSKSFNISAGNAPHSPKKKSIVKATENGLYIEEADFFRQEKVQKTIEDIMKSDVYKVIIARREGRLKKDF